MPDMAKMQPVADRTIDSTFNEGLHNLNERDQVFFLLWSYAGVVDGGGLPAFFYNSPADYYSETLDAFRRLKLENFAHLLEQAAQLLFNGEVPRTTDERNAVIDGLEEDDEALDEEIEKIDRLHFEYGGGDFVLDALEAWFLLRSAQD